MSEGHGHSFGHHGDGGSGHGGHHGHLGDLSNTNVLGSDLQAYSLSTFLEGLQINSGTRFAILFISFIGWLYVVYWIRHHEPFLNQTIGMVVPQASTASEDKSLVAGIKNVLPLHTSPDMGTMYVPSIEENKIMAKSKESQKVIHVGPGQAISAPIEYADQKFDDRFGNPLSHATTQFEQFKQANNSDSVADPLLSNTAPPQNALVPASFSPPTQPSYFITVNNGRSHLLQTVVNR